MGCALCCFEKKNNNENIRPDQGGAGQQFRSAPFDDSRDGRHGLEGGTVGPSHQNQAEAPNSSIPTRAQKKRKGDLDRPESQLGFENAPSLINPDKANNAKKQRKQTESSSAWKQIETQRPPTSYPAERKNHIKASFPDLDRRGLKDRTSTVDATFMQTNAHSKTPLTRISTTNARKSNHSKPPNHHAELQQQQTYDTTVPSPLGVFYPTEIEVTSEENDFKSIKNRRSTYDTVAPDQHLNSKSTSPPGLDYGASRKKVATKFPPTMVTNSSNVNQSEPQRNEESANSTPNLGWSESNNRPFTDHQYQGSSLKNSATDTHSDLLRLFNSSSTNNYHIPAYDGSLDGTARKVSESTATPTKVDENGGFGHKLQPPYYQSIKSPINDFGPFDQNGKRDFSGASPVEAPGCVAEGKVYPTPPTRSFIKSAVKFAPPVEAFPDDLIQLDSKKRDYDDIHFLMDNDQENHRVWNSNKKDISPSDKVDGTGHRKNFGVNPDIRYSCEFFKQISRSLDVSKKDSLHENKWSVEESCSKDTESSLSSRRGPHLAFETKANSETHRPSAEALGAVDCPLLNQATEKPSKKAVDDVHKVTEHSIDQTDAVTHEIKFCSLSLTTPLIEEFSKKVDDTAEENVRSKALSKAYGDERPDQHEETSEKQLGNGSSFYDEAITKIQPAFGEDAVIYEQKPQYVASGIEKPDTEERSQGRQGTPCAMWNTAGQFYFPNLAPSKPAIETSEDISRNDTLDEGKPPKADQHLGEGQVCKSDGEYSESFVMEWSRDSSIPQFSTSIQVNSEDAGTWNDQKLISFSSTSMSNGQTPSWSGQMSEDLKSFPNIESTIHFDPIPQRNQTSIDPNANYTYHEERDLRITDATKQLRLQSLDEEQPDKPTLTSSPQTHVRDVQLRTNFDTLKTSGILNTNLQKPGVHPHTNYKLKEIGENYGKEQFPTEFNRTSSSYDINPPLESPIKAPGGFIALPTESAYAEEAIPGVERQFPKDPQAEVLSKLDTDKNCQTELQKRIIQDLEQIWEKAKPFEKEIEDFTELEDSNKHYYIEESLRRLVDKLDDLYDDIGDDEMLRLKRKEVYRYIFPMFDELDNKVQFNRDRMENNEKR